MCGILLVKEPMEEKCFETFIESFLLIGGGRALRSVLRCVRGWITLTRLRNSHVQLLSSLLCNGASTVIFLTPRPMIIHNDSLLSDPTYPLALSSLILSRCTPLFSCCSLSQSKIAMLNPNFGVFVIYSIFHLAPKFFSIASFPFGSFFFFFFPSSTCSFHFFKSIHFLLQTSFIGNFWKISRK